MAAKTPSSIVRSNAGSETRLTVTFTDLDDGDTWASGLPNNVKSQFFTRTDDPSTQASVGVAVAESSGTFTFYPAEDNAAGILTVLING